MHILFITASACGAHTAMPGKRMRQLVKVEPTMGGELAEEQLQQVTAAAERDGRRRRGEKEDGGTGHDVMLLTANAEAQAFALWAVERVRMMGEELLRLEEQNAGLQAGLRVKDAAHAAVVLAMKSELQTKEAALQAREAAHKVGTAFCLQSIGAAQLARDAVVLSTALFPFSSNAARRASCILLSPDRLTTACKATAWLPRLNEEQSSKRHRPL
jgi:hypothetical protein